MQGPYSKQLTKACLPTNLLVINYVNIFQRYKPELVITQTFPDQITLTSAYCTVGPV